MTMTPLPKVKVLLSLALAVAGIWLSVGARHPFAEHAPDAILTTLTGKKIALKDWRGKPVIVTFWATDCPACIAEIPHLVDLYRQYHRRGLEIVAVAMAYDPPSHVVAMSQAKQLPYEVVLDLASAHATAFGDVRLTPTTFLITPEGLVAEHITGAIDPAVMKERIAAMLNEG